MSMFAFSDSYFMFGGPAAPATPPETNSGSSDASSTIATTRPATSAGELYYLVVVYKNGTDETLTTPAGYTSVADALGAYNGEGRLRVYKKTSAGESSGTLNVTASAAVDSAWVFLKCSGVEADLVVTNGSYSEPFYTPSMSAAEASTVWHFVTSPTWPRVFTPPGDYTEQEDVYAANGPAICAISKDVAAGSIASATVTPYDAYDQGTQAGDGTLIVSLVINGSGTGGGGGVTPPLGTFYVGSHAHGLSNGNDRFASGAFPLSTNTMEPFNFGPIRKHDVEMLHDGAIGHLKWWTGSNRTPGATGGNSYAWSTLDAWTDKVVGRGHNIILTIFGSPIHAARLSNYYDNYNILGGTSGPVNLTAYKEFVRDTVDHIVARHGLEALLAVEGWNEALGGGDNSTTADFCIATGYPAANSLTALQTMVADMQKATWDGVKASTAPDTHVISPSMAYLSSADLDRFFAMKTTGNVSIFSYCDGIAFHPYGMYDPSGAWNGTWADFATFTAAIRTRMATAGISTYPLWGSEVGLHAPWNATSSSWWSSQTTAQKATALYAWIQSYYDEGWKGIMTYSADDDYTQPAGYENGYIGSPGVSSQTIRSALSSAYVDFQGANVPDPVPSSTAPVGQNAANWALSFEDDFAGSGLDANKWSTPIWYSDLPTGSAGPNVATGGVTVNYDVNNGSNSLLRIWPALDSAGKFFNRTIHTDSMGGSTASGSKFLQKYGFFEMRAKLPTGRGCWPAFWLFGHYDVSGSAPTRPEIDIMEAYCGGYDYTNNAQPGWANSGLQPTTWAPTFHSDAAGSGQVSVGPSMETPGDVLSAAFHVYGLKWSAGGVFEWFYDGASVGSTTYTALDKLDTYPQAIYLDLWFGSASGYVNTSETPRGSGNAFEIDYIRAWTAR